MASISAAEKRAVSPTSPPVPATPRRKRSRAVAAALSATAGLIALVALTAAYAMPATLPFMAPIAVLLGAIALWGTARIDHMRLARDLEKMSAENRRLSESLESFADKTWEARESEERYRAVVEARQKAEAASLSKSRFLATVSHEFRTPLNGILGLTGLLLESDLTPDQQTYARGVQSSGDALLALVDDILDFSKIEAGRLDLRPEPIELEALLQEIVELLAARAHAKGIDIAADLDPKLPARVMVDGTRLRQVLLNLAGNGVKFTEAGGVRISAALDATGERPRVIFDVADSGPGVPPAEAERIFGEFEQADGALTRRHGGTGLGLAISRRIVRRMGSDISLVARPNGGSIFRFSLDVDTVAGTPPLATTLAGRRLLILMPEAFEAPVISKQLEENGAEARITSNANEAAALAGAAVAAGLPYDAVLVDRRLSADAGATLGRIREAAGRKIPAAIIIEPGQRTEVERLRGEGFDAYLVRPVRRASLQKIVGEIVAASGEFRVDPSDAQRRRPAPARKAVRGLEILLAEDNEINALLVRAVLEQLGHNVTAVRDGSAAVAAVREGNGRFAVILMDLHMPGLDGIAAARAIRGYEVAAGLAPATILALTADVLAETRAAAEAAGIDGVLAKPIAPERLRKALDDLAVSDEPRQRHAAV